MLERMVALIFSASLLGGCEGAYKEPPKAEEQAPSWLEDLKEFRQRADPRFLEEHKVRFVCLSNGFRIFSPINPPNPK